jgi:hypothetical protein
LACPLGHFTFSRICLNPRGVEGHHPADPPVGTQPLANLPFCLPPPLPTIAKEDEVRGRTMGTIWSDEHVTQATSGLTKALRIACTRGVKDAEVRKRLKGVHSELAWAAFSQGKARDCL